LTYHAACFGSPLRTAYAPELLNPIWRPIHTYGAPSLGRLLDITVRPYRGVFYCAPVYALMAIGLDHFRRDRVELRLAAAATVLYLLVLSGMGSAFGGACLGPRYLVPVLPLSTLLLVPASRVVPRLFALLFAVGALVMLAASLADPLPPETFRDPLSEVVFPRLLAGSVQSHNAFEGLLSPLGAFFVYLVVWVSVGGWLRARTAR
jgi:hypothetical protein